MCSCQRTQPAFEALENRIQVVGVTGVEPATLRLSSACSNQLSYTPAKRPRLVGGAEEGRTPDLQLAKLPLYQLSYSPVNRARLPMSPISNT